MSVIVNTTVLSNFASISQLEVLHQLYPILYMPTQVYDEVRHGRDEGYHFYGDIEQHIYPLTSAGWLHLTSLDTAQALQMYGELPGRLHHGEAACIAIAYDRGWLFLSDDRAARAEATRLGITISGSLGCLVLAIERKISSVEQGNVWLAAMIAQGYHAPLTDLTHLLRR